MSPNEIVIKAARALDRAKIPYMVVGAFAGNIHGITRNTYDADFVIQLEAARLDELVRCLAPDFNFDRQIAFESVAKMTHFYRATHVDPFFEIEFFLLSDDPHDRLGYERRKTHLLMGQPLAFLTSEDFIITKLRWAKSGRRHKDIDDARGVLAVQQGRLDLAYIRHWCGEHGTLELLESAMRSIPPLSS